jgi:hypothetical protein
MPAAGFGHVAIPRFAKQAFPADDRSVVRRPFGPDVVPTTNRVPIARALMPAAPADNEVGVGDYSRQGIYSPPPFRHVAGALLKRTTRCGSQVVNLFAGRKLTM